VDAGLPESALETWFARFLRDALALEAAGSYRAFREVASGALEVIFSSKGVTPSRDTMEAVLGAFASLDPHPEAGRAFVLGPPVVV
jgi:2-haloacid dehalogenase